MVDLSALTTLSKSKRKGFAEQKRLIAQVLAGKQVDCPTCNQKLYVVWEEDGISLIRCDEKCTDIKLEVEY